MIYLNLLWEFIQIGLFTIGGGYAALPLIKNRIVDINGYISLAEFMDIIAIAESTPGPIAINAATFVGVKTAGILGGLISTIGFVLPSLTIVLILSLLYSKYKELSVIKTTLKTIRPVTLGLIAVAAATIIKLAFLGGQIASIDNIDYVAIGLFAVSLIALRAFKLNPIWIMLGCGGAGLLLYWII